MVGVRSWFSLASASSVLAPGFAATACAQLLILILLSWGIWLEGFLVSGTSKVLAPSLSFLSASLHRQTQGRAEQPRTNHIYWDQGDGVKEGRNTDLGA